MQAYFDNSATTAVCPQAIEKVNFAMKECWGNPSSFHYIGNEADRLLSQSRLSVSNAIGCKSEEVFFTSGGTESNNLALFGTANALQRSGKRIVITSAEHPSVYDAASRLEASGFEVIRLPLNEKGTVSATELINAVNKDTILVSVMYVNNETGAVMPVELCKKAIVRAGSPALVHIDAVQAFGKININPAKLGADLMSVSSHKVHGPKGVGALYMKKGTKIRPILYGGEQGLKIRPGTEAMPAIAGFGAACEELGHIDAEYNRIKALRDRMLDSLFKSDGIVVNSPPDALPYVTNISVIGIKSEPMLNYLSSQGICVSAGSACSKGKRSRVLSEMKLSNERIDSAVRISFSRFTTEDEVDYLVRKIIEAKSVIYKSN